MAKFQPDDEVIRKLAVLLEETGLTEIEYEAEGRRVRVARGGAPMIEPPPAPASLPAGPAPGAAEGAEPGLDAVPAGAVTAPMVGTVYVASEPGAPAFVQVGDSVSEGQTLLIIEAMKVMNPLPSPRAGTITQILVRDGQPVEYGEPLIVVE